MIQTFKLNKNYTKLDYSALKDAIELVRGDYPNDAIENNKLLAHVISVEFECLCIERDIDEFYSPNIEEESEDRRLIYEHNT